MVMQPEIRLDLNNVDGPARIWAQQEPIQREMAYVFRKFLKEFADPVTGEPVYSQRMSRMCKGEQPACTVLQLPLGPLDPQVVLSWNRATAYAFPQAVSHVVQLLQYDAGSSQQSCQMADMPICTSSEGQTVHCTRQGG